MHVLIGLMYVVFVSGLFIRSWFFFQAEDGIRDLVRSRGLGDVYKRQIAVGPFGEFPFLGIRIRLVLRREPRYVRVKKRQRLSLIHI